MARAELRPSRVPGSPTGPAADEVGGDLEGGGVPGVEPVGVGGQGRIGGQGLGEVKSAPRHNPLRRHDSRSRATRGSPGYDRPVTSRALLLLALALCGCPGSGPSDGDGWVQVGQRWRFTQPALAGAEQVYTVTAVSPTQVDYDVQAWVADEPIGEPVTARFLRHPPPQWSGPGEAVIWTVSGLRLPCHLRESPTGRVWTAGREGPEFPGDVRATDSEGRVLLELVEVEAPAD